MTTERLKVWVVVRDEDGDISVYVHRTEEGASKESDRIIAEWRSCASFGSDDEFLDFLADCKKSVHTFLLEV